VTSGRLTKQKVVQAAKVVKQKVVQAAKVVKQKVVQAAKAVKQAAETAWKATVDFAQTYWHYAKYWWPRVGIATGISMLTAVTAWFGGPYLLAGLSWLGTRCRGRGRELRIGIRDCGTFERVLS